MTSAPEHTLAAPRRLGRDALPHETVALARALIGKTLVHEAPEGRMSVRIVETEAYPVGDAAGHAFIGQTRRNASLFRAFGHAYVYLGYGVSWLLNVSSESHGVGAGVLLRAGEPIEGVDIMMRRRGRGRLAELTSGPGKLCMAMDVDKRLDGADFFDGGPLWLGEAVRPAGDIGVSVRIGITKDAERPLRFYERGNPFVSGPRKLSP
ncbi:MAG: DNA-3-methyladenine glycosylase [Caulobacteraceae bacterium]|nr:DNA-3-methyladenine glycosylase [Caulobacteraceae bacterium]